MSNNDEWIDALNSQEPGALRNMEARAKHDAARSEREECAKLCDMAASDERYPVGARSLATVLAATIRRRGGPRASEPFGGYCALCTGEDDHAGLCPRRPGFDEAKHRTFSQHYRALAKEVGAQFDCGAAIAFGLMGMAEAIQHKQDTKDMLAEFKALRAEARRLQCIHSEIDHETLDRCAKCGAPVDPKRYVLP